MSNIHIGGNVTGQVAMGEKVNQNQSSSPEPQSGVSETSSAPIIILFWASNPIDTNRLRLDEEVRSIDERLRLSEYRDRFDLRQQWAVRITDLSEGLLRHRPVIVHFSGHGNRSGDIAVELDDGTAGPVPVSGLAGLFAVVANDEAAPRCVVFNACYSEAVAEAVAQHVDFVVGTTTSIGDRAAVAFAAGFYRALGYGSSIRSAFDLGCNEIELKGLGQEAVPRLLSPRVDPRQVRLVSDTSVGANQPTRPSDLEMGR